MSTGGRVQAAASERPEFDAEDLTHIDLRGRDLVQVDLSGRDLRGADFSGADLTGALLMGAVLVNCSFRDAIVEQANFVGADLAGADFTGCSGRQAILGQCNLRKAVFFSADLAGASLSGAEVVGVDFRVAKLDGVRMLESNLTDCEFSRSSMRKADLTGARVGGAIFRDTDLSSASLRGLVGFDHADWVSASITGVEFSGAYLVRRAIMDQNYLHEFRSLDRTHEILYQLWRLTSDCGRSFARWGFLTAVLAVVFAILYTQVEIDYGSQQTVLSPLYFSVVTLTTLGFGDVLPASLVAQVLVLIEVVIGYVMLGGVLSIFATRMGRRAD